MIIPELNSWSNLLGKEYQKPYFQLLKNNLNTPLCHDSKIHFFRIITQRYSLRKMRSLTPLSCVILIK